MALLSPEGSMGQEWEEQKGPQVVPPPCTHYWGSFGNAENVAGSSACQGTSPLLPLPPCQILLIPHGSCTSPGPWQPVCGVLPGKWHGYRHWHCQHPLPPPWGCAWALGCCGFCGNASTSFCAAGASVSCWTREGPPQCHRTPSSPACPDAVGE